jgi:hypothetical protein
MLTCDDTLGVHGFTGAASSKAKFRLFMRFDVSESRRSHACSPKAAHVEREALPAQGKSWQR